MSIADKITSIAGHLEDDYTALEQLGVSVEDRNIENIKDMANQIYAKFPKTDYEEGSNITLSNTLKGKLDFEDGIVGYGDTKQEGTPTPDSPQDIEVVRGKNRFDGELLPNSYNPTTGEIEASSTSYRSNKIPLQKNETYYLSGITGNVRVLYWNNTSYVSSEVITMPNSFITKGNIIAFQFDKSLSHENIMIEKGSQATSYLPYNTLEVVERGKNYCGFNSVSSTGMGVDYIIDKSEITLNGTTNGGGYIYTSTTNFITIPKGTYKLSGYILGGSYNYVGDIEIALKKASNNTKVLTLYKTHYDNQATITLTEDTDLYYGIYTNGSNNVLNNFKIGIQIEEGSTATTYEPYITPITKQLSLGDIELCKIGNYVDTIEYDVDNDKVYKNVNVGKQILNGNETPTISAVSDNTTRIHYNYNLLPYDAKGGTLGLCNRLIAKGNWNIDEEGFYFNSNQKQLIMRINKSIVGTTQSSVNTWLENNNMVFYYVLAETVKEEITGTLKDQIKALYNSHSFTGTTIIEIDGQLPLIIKVRALKGN